MPYPTLTNKTPRYERESSEIPAPSNPQDYSGFSFQNLLKAYYQCRRNKRKTINATKFELNFERELLKLESELKNHTYQPGAYICFAITDPKLREVWASDFRDRVVHHLLISYLEPVWKRKFIFHSYACRQDKGAHKAIYYLKKVVSPLRHSAPVKRQTLNNFYYLQIDIQSFFPSINKDILFLLIQKHVKNFEILWLAQKIIFQNPTDNYIIKGDKKLLHSIPKHKSLLGAPEDIGLPIGNLTSQFFANLYLNELDQFIKHKLKCRHYFRYMDDLVLLHSDKTQLLKWRNEISFFLNKHLQLKLHPKKQTLQPITHGIDFLGYIVKPDYLLSRRRVVSNIKQKLYYFNKALNPATDFKPDKSNNLKLPLLYSDKLPSLDFIQKAQAVINSYYGHFKHANCLQLRKALYFKYFKELTNFLEPADKEFSYFIVKKSYLNFTRGLMS